MPRRLAVVLALATACAGRAAAPASPPYPPARQDNVVETLHGVTIVDPYRWLEDQRSPETRAFIDAQNAYAHALLDPFSGRSRILARLTALSRVDTMSGPFERGGRYFTARRRTNDELTILYVRDGLRGEDRVLVDPHPLSPDRTTSVGFEDFSRDGRRIVYFVRRGGEDESELRVRDVDAGRDLPDVLTRDLYRGVSWDGDGAGFYYARQDRKSGIRIRHHALGTPVDADVETFGAGFGREQWVSADVSENGRWLVFSVAHGWAKDEIYVKDLRRTDGPIITIVKGPEAHFNAAFAGDRLLVLTDWNAPTGRIVEIDPAHPEPAAWREVVPARREAIERFAAIGGRLVVQRLRDVTARVELYALDGRPLGELALPGLGAVAAIRGRWDATEMFYEYASYTQPPTTFRADLATGASEVWWRAPVPFAGDDYETRQAFYTSRDGTRVPMFIVHRKGLARDGKRPTLLHGYGGFAVSQTPRFGAFSAWWVEQGGVYAVANIRGGSEYGEEWHRAGMLADKQNVFDDFIAAAEFLVAERYTNPDRLAIRGGSNGGLLVAAAFTQRPDLFRAVLCEFPDLDMIGYHRFENNNPPALLEYGDASKREEFEFLYKYSPYQRVRAGVRYPAVLFVTGDADTRVPPLQARKMTARMQAATAGGRPILLLYDTKAGHSGGRPIGKLLADLTLETAFLARELGMDVSAPAAP